MAGNGIPIVGNGPGASFFQLDNIRQAVPLHPLGDCGLGIEVNDTFFPLHYLTNAEVAQECLLEEPYWVLL